MKKFAIQVTALVLVAFGGLYVYQHPEALNVFFPQKNARSQTQPIKVGETVLNVEVADSETERAQGLGGREQLASNSGMLFIFPGSNTQQFWMKGMIIPVDMVFINEGKVVDMLKNVPPPQAGQKDSDLPIYRPTVPINMVLEINAGSSDSQNIKIGDAVYIIKN